MALMSFPCINRWATFSTSNINKNCGDRDVLQYHIFPRDEKKPLSTVFVILNSITAIKSKRFLEDDFESETTEDEYEQPDAKVINDDDDVSAADEYFGRFISEAFKGDKTDRTISSDSKSLSSSPPSDENILLETRRMMEQQQQQIDLLMKLMNKQSQQQLPSQTASSTNMYDNSDGQSHASQYPSKFLAQQKPTIVPPLKAMLFIDGTWLYYSLNTRNPKHDAIVVKYGKGWQNNYKVDW